MKRIVASAFLSIALAASPCFAEVLYREARVIDGDTIEISNTRIRLEGIDAPEIGQDCNGHSVGLASKIYLLRMTEGREVSCELSGVDKYGRALGTCYIGDMDINGMMVRAGMAYAYRRYSILYVAEEELAKRNDIGVWACDCEEPWIWRRR